MVRVALDAMGGDHAPEEIIQGGLKALKENPEVIIKLVGKPEIIEKFLQGQDYDRERLHIVAASEVIENEEAPVAAIRRKKDSSIVRAMKLVKDREADAFVSAGSTGAVLVGSQLVVGRLPGIHRAPLAPLIPTEKGFSLLVDCGANVDARAMHLLQFAKMGSVYMEKMLGIEKPRVAIVNVGAEEEKGNALVKECFPLLKECREINFTGSIEAREIPRGQADVIVCEAFTGNVILKLYEGVGQTLLSKIKGALMSDLRSKIGAVLIKPALKRTLKTFDASEYGGAPLLGLNGLVIKAHGNSKRGEICNSVRQCIEFHDKGLHKLIEESIHSEAREEM